MALDGAFEVERVLHDNNQTEEWRVKLRFGGHEVCGAAFVEEGWHRGRPDRYQHATQAAIEHALDHALRKIRTHIMREITDVYRATNSYDTTVAREQERRRGSNRGDIPPRATEIMEQVCLEARAMRTTIDSIAFERLVAQGFNVAISATAAPESVTIGIDLAYLPPGEIFKPFREKRNTPERKAMSLLARKIGKAKYRSLKSRGYFEEQGRSGLFRFKSGSGGGVTFIQAIQVGALKSRNIIWELCVQSSAASLPVGDVILSRWLEFRANEDEFLKTANFRSVSTPDEAVNWRVNPWATSPVGTATEIMVQRGV